MISKRITTTYGEKLYWMANLANVIKHTGTFDTVDKIL
jgi:hypothetical protein